MGDRAARKPGPDSPPVEYFSVPRLADTLQPQLAPPPSRPYRKFSSLRGLTRILGPTRPLPARPMPILFSSLPSTTTSSFSSASASNVCMYCNTLGHWSNDCPLECSACKKRGHEAKACVPVCDACNGSGVIRREKGDDRAPVVLELQAMVAGVRRASQRLRTLVDNGDAVANGGRADGRADSVQGKDIHTLLCCPSVKKEKLTRRLVHQDTAAVQKLEGNIASMLVYAAQIEEDLKTMGL